MPSVLLCCHREKSIHAMKAFLKTYDDQDVLLATDAKAAQKQLTRCDISLILIDLPFTMDHQELSFILSMSEASNAYVVAIIKRSEYKTLRDKIEKFGVFTLMKPIQQDQFIQLLSFIKTARYRVERLTKKQAQLIGKIQEIKLVDRAKCLLIEHTFITEEEAHKQIERTAMNERVTRSVIAQRIIHEYEK